MFLKKVKCKAHIVRKDGKWLHPAEWKTMEKKWVRIESEFTGTITGKRTLSNGTVQYDDNHYTPDEYFRAYIVVFDMYKKPVYVLPEDLKIIE